jgi:DNA-binding LacI/PurR family transcriptional regulator
VVIGREFAHPGVDRVAANDGAGGFAAVRHLAELGHRRIAFIGGSVAPQFQLPRCAGYLTALRAQQLAVDPDLVVPPIAGEKCIFATQQDGYAGMQRLLSMRRRPTAVFARNDYTAMGALLAARESGVAVPGGMSIIGFDNVPLSSFTAPPLTTINQPMEEQGREAATLLLRRIQSDETVERVERVFDCQLVVRESAARPA